MENVITEEIKKACGQQTEYGYCPPNARCKAEAFDQSKKDLYDRCLAEADKKRARQKSGRTWIIIVLGIIVIVSIALAFYFRGKK